MKKLNCTFITPYREKEIFLKWKKKLEAKYDDIQVLGIDGNASSGGAKSFFDAWKRALPEVTKKYICLTHDDTEYLEVPDLDKLFKKDVGMIGVAGTTVLHKDQPWWFSGERMGGGMLSGEIWNTEEGKEDSHSVFGPYGEVVVLDGVCMLTTKKIIEDVGIPEKDYGTFDFYDHIISLEFIKKGYKIFTAPIKILHKSKGGDKRPSFFDSLDKFKAEYLEGKTWRI